MLKYVVGPHGEEMNIPCQQKIKEYGITDEQLQICSYICLDNVIVKDRWGLSYLPQPDKVMKIDME